MAGEVHSVFLLPIKGMFKLTYYLNLSINISYVILFKRTCKIA